MTSFIEFFYYYSYYHDCSALVCECVICYDSSGTEEDPNHLELDSIVPL